MKYAYNLLAPGVVAIALACSSDADASLVNGGFETLIGGPITSVGQLPASSVPGWQTTASDNLIEIWGSGFGGVPSHSGVQHAELNANFVSTLYQDVFGLGIGSILDFQFAHRGRAGLDTMRFSITDLGLNGVLGGGDDTVLYSALYTDGNTAWGFYTGTGFVALGNTVRFEFESVSAAGGNPAIGNFLDSAGFGVAVPEPSSLALALGAAGALLATSKRTRSKRGLAEGDLTPAVR